MNIKLSNLLSFAAGAVIGSVVTWKVVSDRYEQIIEAMQDRFENFTVADAIEAGGNVELVDEITTVPEQNAIDDMRNIYKNIAREEGYIQEEEEEYMPEPYVISPDDFAELDGYNTETLYYFADNVMTDDEENILDELEDIIGDIDPVKHFGEYEKDSIFVRNDEKQCDYEILRDTRKYYDIYPEE
jgi:hypothetical protein